MEKKSSRVVVITGASSGIGKECRTLFEKNGDKVISLSRTNPDNVGNHIVCDLSNFDDIKKAFLKIQKDFGKIDVLINNAGFGISGALEFTSVDEIKKIYDVNLLGASICLKYALPLMHRGSKVINISSACAFFPLPYHALYSSSKAGLSSLSFAMRMECKSLGIDVTAICPGTVRTNFTKNKIKNFKTSDRYEDRVERSIYFV